MNIEKLQERLNNFRFVDFTKRKKDNPFEYEHVHKNDEDFIFREKRRYLQEKIWKINDYEQEILKLKNMQKRIKKQFLEQIRELEKNN